MLNGKPIIGKPEKQLSDTIFLNQSIHSYHTLILRLLPLRLGIIIGLGEHLQERPIFNGKIYGFWLRFSLKPIHWDWENFISNSSQTSSPLVAPWLAAQIPPWKLWCFPYFIELDDGKIYRKALYLMVKTMVSCRFSLKPIHCYVWLPEGIFISSFMMNWWELQRSSFHLSIMGHDWEMVVKLKWYDDHDGTMTVNEWYLWYLVVSNDWNITGT